MKKVSIQLFAMAIMWLCASVTAFAAVDWSQYDYLGDGAGGGKYSNKYKVETGNGLSAVNIQLKNDVAGIYINVPAAIKSISVDNTIEGAGAWLHLSAFTAQETEVTLIHATGTINFHVYYADGKQGSDNVLLNAAAYASSGTAANGNDGNESTRWESASSDPQWWVANMGKQCSFNTVQILWEGAYAKSFTLEVSNDSLTWTTVATITDQTLSSFPYRQNITVGDQTAQYLRFNGTARGTAYGYSFWEISAFEKKAQTLTSLDLKAAASIVKCGESLNLTATAKDQDGEVMDTEITYTVSPADMGTVADGKFTAATTIGNATITATAGTLTKSVTVFCYKGDNLALSTNIGTDNKIIAQSNTDYTQGATDAYYAVDGNAGSVYQGCATGTTSDAEADRTYDVWFVVDLGVKCDLNLISIQFEGACSQLYHIDFADTYTTETVWKTGYNYVGNAGVNGHTDYIYGDDLQNATGVRYVRFYSTKAATQYGMKIFEFQVYGIEGAKDPSVLTSIDLTASANTLLVGETATLTAVAKDQYNKAMDAEITYAVDQESVGTIADGVFTAKAVGTATITATSGAVSKSITIDVISGPTAAPAAPTYPANQVKAVYSATYNADCNFGEWGSGTTCTPDAYGKKYVLGQNRYFGLEFSTLNCSQMEALHLDIYPLASGTVRVVPIRKNASEAGVVTETLEAGKWNSIDIALSEFTGVTDWSEVIQIKFDNAQMQTFWLNNVYFYTTQAPATDTEAPTALVASVATTSYFSADIKAKATDNSGIVVIKVFDGTTEMASKSVNSDTETTVTVSTLTPGTDYNFTVAAYDEAGNKADTDVTVTLSTKALPAPATAPTAAAEDVYSLYSDAYTASATFAFGQWSQSTVTTVATLAEGDQAYLCTNSNYLGFELNGSTAIDDMTNMPYFHIDIYVETAGTIGFTPIWGSEALKTYTLAAGWNALDIDLLTDFPAINLANIFQLKLANMPATCFFDNMYFHKKAATAIDNATTEVKAQKVLRNGQVLILRNGIYYNVQGQKVAE